jgi:hypothetical protein
VNTVTLLAELEAAGIQVTPQGENLRVRGEPGVNLAPYLERIMPHKSVPLRQLLQRQIVAAVDVEPPDFDQQHYDDLWCRNPALEGKEHPA